MVHEVIFLLQKKYSPFFQFNKLEASSKLQFLRLVRCKDWNSLALFCTTYTTEKSRSLPSGKPRKKKKKKKEQTTAVLWLICQHFRSIQTTLYSKLVGHAPTEICQTPNKDSLGKIKYIGIDGSKKCFPNHLTFEKKDGDCKYILRSVTLSKKLCSTFTLIKT